MFPVNESGWTQYRRLARSAHPRIWPVSDRCKPSRLDYAILIMVASFGLRSIEAARDAVDAVGNRVELSDLGV